MKIGMIFECGPDGADKKVGEWLAKRIRQDLELMSITLDNKPNLVSECGRSTADLIAQGCERVLIFWDLYPPWRKDGERPCRKEDRENILQSLKEAGVPLKFVSLICITEELEAWLIADGRALSVFLSTPSHPVRIKDEKKPERVRNPKKKLLKLFRETIGKEYVDMLHAEKIVRNLPDFKKIRRAASFLRFEEKLN